MHISHNNNLTPFSYNFANFANLDRNCTLVNEIQFKEYKENKDAFFNSMTIPETPLQDSDGFQLVTNRKRRRQMLQTLAAQENEPIPDANDVFSDSDGN